MNIMDMCGSADISNAVAVNNRVTNLTVNDSSYVPQDDLWGT